VLLLVLGDRIDVAGSRVRAVFEGRPDNLVSETGVLGEAGAHPVASRFGRGRADLKHAWIDPLLVAAPVVVVLLTAVVVRRRR
jgi:hypothetical protein